MSDPIARADQEVEEIKGQARIHAAYYLQLLESGMEPDDALSSMQTMMWISAKNSEYEDEE
jgi:hypothetical protein